MATKQVTLIQMLIQSQLSLTHFCEVHGPTSIICSQVIPFSCPQCYPEKLDSSSDDIPATSHDTKSSFQSKLDKETAENSTTTTTTTTPKIEDHPYFLKNNNATTDTERSSRTGSTGRDSGDTCASCSLTLPDDVSKQLPPGAPGTSEGDGSKNTSSPVLRSREVVYSCGNNHAGDGDDSPRESHTHASYSSSVQSSSVASSDTSTCHTHLLTYLSLRGPPNPSDYALLRRSSIRTLSCELLPRGLSSGPICFGDSAAGYTIAYIFRLPDPMARGKRRSYALVALAGKDAGRAFRACPVIWRAFGRIASGIVSSAEKYQEDEKRREEEQNGASRAGGRQYTPVSSFLTGRALDPDGQPRRLGQIRARNLAEIVGNQFIFAEIHANFVALLQQLGAMFGGVPVSEEQFVCSTVRDDANGRRASVATAAEGKDKPRHPPSSQKQDDSDLGMSTLDISSGPQPIPIAPRRSVIA